jgi:predicted MFS family arabinose efflux permease
MTGGTRWGIVWLATAAGVIAAMQLGKVSPVIPRIAADLAIGTVTAGFVVSIFVAASALFGPIGGVLGDRVGHRRYLIGGLACVAVAGVAGGLAPNATGLLVARLVEGFGFLAVTVAAPSIIVAVCAPRDTRVALGIWGAYIPAGIALMMVATPALIGPLGWRGIWFLNAGLLVLFLLLFAAATGGTSGRPERPGSLADVRTALSRPGPWLLAASLLVFGFQFLGMVSWLPSFFVEEAGFGPDLAALTTAGIVALNAVGNPIGGWLLRFVARPALLGMAAAALGVLAVLVFDPGTGTGLKIALAGLFSLVGGFIPAAVLTGAPVYAPSPGQIGATNGVIVQGANLGSLIGPPALAAVVAWAGGWGDARWFLCAMAAVGVVLALALRGIERRSDRSVVEPVPETAAKVPPEPVEQRSEQP